MTPDEYYYYYYVIVVYNILAFNVFKLLILELTTNHK